MEKESFFITRHSSKPDKNNPESISKPGISEKGVELAKTKTGELKKMIDQTPENAVVFIAGATETVRTASTAEIYGEKLAELYTDDESTIVIPKKEIGKMVKEKKSFSETRDDLAKLINENNNKRIVLSFPMMINELSFGKRWGFWDAEGAKYFEYLNKKYGKDEESAFNEWIKTGGKTDQEGIQGPNPEEVARDYIKGLRRLKEFVKKYIKDRPIIIGAVTHRYDLDACAVKLLKGKINSETAREVLGDHLSEETELVYIEIDGENINVKFRNYEK